MPYEKIAYQKSYHKKWYADPKNAAKKKENAKLHRTATKIRNREFIRQYKADRGCSRCTEKHPACIDFHHTSPDTKFKEVSLMLKYGIDTIKAEIAKCILLCKNCHAKLHDAERNTGV